MRTMLSICDAFASLHGLKFNASKTQLVIYFRSRSIHPIIVTILCLCATLIVLYTLVMYDLDDRPDISRVVKDMNCKANSILCTFKWADPFIKCKILLSVIVWLCPMVIILSVSEDN